MMPKRQHFISHSFAPGLVGAFQDSDGGDGGHDPSPSMKGSHNCRGSGVGCGLRRLSAGGRRFVPREASCSIGEPLALRADDRAISALQIVDSESDPVVVPEIELGSVAM